MYTVFFLKGRATLGLRMFLGCVWVFGVLRGWAVSQGLTAISKVSGFVEGFRFRAQGLSLGFKVQSLSLFWDSFGLKA